MKHSVSVLAVASIVALVGGGCAKTSSSPQNAQEPQTPQVRLTGCSPKAIAIQEPMANANVKMPFEVRVEINNGAHKDCRWSLFEGQAGSLNLQDDKGNILGRGILTTQEDWMTDKMVKFDGTVHPVPGATVQGTLSLVISEDDPSGQKEPQAVIIPVNVTP